MVPILDSSSTNFFITHEKYLYIIPLDISVYLAASASLPQELTTSSLTQNYPSGSVD
jgi:hypothetical protein